LVAFIMAIISSEMDNGHYRKWDTVWLLFNGR
jgi:hypothetical protein